MENQPNRRHFIQQLALLGGATMVLPFGCKESIPNDVIINRIVQFTFKGKRPKYVGKNSRLDDHTQYGRDRGILVFTNNGLIGIGTYWGDKTSLQSFLGKSLLDWFNACLPRVRQEEIR